MSGIEPLLLAAATGIGEAAVGVGSAIGSAAGSVGSAVGAATVGEIASGVGALSSAAGAGASLLSKPPKISTPTMPTRDTARMEADQRSLALKRRGRAATLLSGAEGVTSAPTLGSPSLTGTA